MLNCKRSEKSIDLTRSKAINDDFQSHGTLAEIAEEPAPYSTQAFKMIAYAISNNESAKSDRITFQ
ncbi:hypothetical protein JXJ21_10155 [candidate division KSB1 bacterium]|nr:hypothetical protein [candidate division KSB1 bacterium]